MCITKSRNLLEVTVKFLSRYFGSIFPKSLSLAIDICSKFSKLYFALFQVFMKLMRQAEVYDEEQDQNRSIESQRKMRTLKMVCN